MSMRKNSWRVLSHRGYGLLRPHALYGREVRAMAAESSAVQPPYMAGSHASLAVESVLPNQLGRMLVHASLHTQTSTGYMASEPKHSRLDLANLQMPRSERLEVSCSRDDRER